MPDQNTCPSCGEPGLTPFYEVRGVPVHSVVLLHSRDEALRYPRGDIVLGFCRACGFIPNMAFDPSLQDYSVEYEASQAFSPTFGAFAVEVAQRLVDEYGLHDKDIVEIGCGQGEFLTLLCELGGNRGLGFDPAYVEGREDIALPLPPSAGRGRRAEAVQASVRIVKDYYSEAHAPERADLVCCKMTLEHIADVGRFVRMVRRSLEGQPEAVVFFQVPDVTRILEERAFWDIYYEHCSYFAPLSLAGLFERSGFDVLRLATEYEGQYLMIDARPNHLPRPAPHSRELARLAERVRAFRRGVGEALDGWRRRLGALRAGGRRAVIWGAGSKAVAFLTTLGVGDAVEYAVDINPNKHGTYLAGTGQEIVAPEFLREYRPDLVIVMNPVYCREISGQLRALGVETEVAAL